MKTGYIAGAVALVVVLVGAWYITSQKTSSSALIPAGSNEKEAPTSGTLAALAARGGSWKCDVTQVSDAGSTTGTVYVSGGKVRGDFTTNGTSAGTMESHMISDGSDIYVWSSMMPTGMKMKATAQSQTDHAASSQQDYYNQNYDYRCAPWSEDAAQFTLPATVTFNDMSAMMQGVGAGTDMKAKDQMPAGMDCSMCEQAPTEDAKAACKAALHC